MYAQMERQAETDHAAFVKQALHHETLNTAMRDLYRQQGYKSAAFMRQFAQERGIAIEEAYSLLGHQLDLEQIQRIERVEAAMGRSPEFAQVVTELSTPKAAPVPPAAPQAQPEAAQPAQPEPQEPPAPQPPEVTDVVGLLNHQRVQQLVDGMTVGHALKLRESSGMSLSEVSDLVFGMPLTEDQSRLLESQLEPWKVQLGEEGLQQRSFWDLVSSVADPRYATRINAALGQGGNALFWSTVTALVTPEGLSPADVRLQVNSGGVIAVFTKDADGRFTVQAGTANVQTTINERGEITGGAVRLARGGQVSTISLRASPAQSVMFAGREPGVEDVFGLTMERPDAVAPGQAPSVTAMKLLTVKTPAANQSLVDNVSAPNEHIVGLLTYAEDGTYQAGASVRLADAGGIHLVSSVTELDGTTTHFDAHGRAMFMLDAQNRVAAINSGYEQAFLSYVKQQDEGRLADLALASRVKWALDNRAALGVQERQQLFRSLSKATGLTLTDAELGDALAGRGEAFETFLRLNFEELSRRAGVAEADLTPTLMQVAMSAVPVPTPSLADQAARRAERLAEIRAQAQRDGKAPVIHAVSPEVQGDRQAAGTTVRGLEAIRARGRVREEERRTEALRMAGRIERSFSTTRGGDGVALTRDDKRRLLGDLTPMLQETGVIRSIENTLGTSWGVDELSQDAALFDKAMDLSVKHLYDVARESRYGMTRERRTELLGAAPTRQQQAMSDVFRLVQAGQGLSMVSVASIATDRGLEAAEVLAMVNPILAARAGRMVETHRRLRELTPSGTPELDDLQVVAVVSEMLGALETMDRQRRDALRQGQNLPVESQVTLDDVMRLAGNPVDAGRFAPSAVPMAGKLLVRLFLKETGVASDEDATRLMRLATDGALANMPVTQLGGLMREIQSGSRNATRVYREAVARYSTNDALRAAAFQVNEFERTHQVTAEEAQAIARQTGLSIDRVAAIVDPTVPASPFLGLAVAQINQIPGTGAPTGFVPTRGATTNFADVMRLAASAKSIDDLLEPLALHQHHLHTPTLSADQALVVADAYLRQAAQASGSRSSELVFVAQQYYRAATQKAPSDPVGHLGLAATYLAMGNVKDGTKALQTAAAKAPHRVALLALASEISQALDAERQGGADMSRRAMLVMKANELMGRSVDVTTASRDPAHLKQTMEQALVKAGIPQTVMTPVLVQAAMGQFAAKPAASPEQRAIDTAERAKEEQLAAADLARREGRGFADQGLSLEVQGVRDAVRWAEDELGEARERALRTGDAFGRGRPGRLAEQAAQAQREAEEAQEAAYQAQREGTAVVQGENQMAELQQLARAPIPPAPAQPEEAGPSVAAGALSQLPAPAAPEAATRGAVRVAPLEAPLEPLLNDIEEKHGQDPQIRGLVSTIRGATSGYSGAELDFLVRRWPQTAEPLEHVESLLNSGVHSFMLTADLELFARRVESGIQAYRHAVQIPGTEIRVVLEGDPSSWSLWRAGWNGRDLQQTATRLQATLPIIREASPSTYRDILQGTQVVVLDPGEKGRVSAEAPRFLPGLTRIFRSTWREGNRMELVAALVEEDDHHQWHRQYPGETFTTEEYLDYTFPPEQQEYGDDHTPAAYLAETHAAFVVFDLFERLRGHAPTHGVLTRAEQNTRVQLQRMEARKADRLLRVLGSLEGKGILNESGERALQQLRDRRQEVLTALRQPATSESLPAEVGAGVRSGAIAGGASVGAGLGTALSATAATSVGMAGIPAQVRAQVPPEFKDERWESGRHRLYNDAQLFWEETGPDEWRPGFSGGLLPEMRGGAQGVERSAQQAEKVGGAQDLGAAEGFVDLTGDLAAKQGGDEHVRINDGPQHGVAQTAPAGLPRRSDGFFEPRAGEPQTDGASAALAAPSARGASRTPTWPQDAALPEDRVARQAGQSVVSLPVGQAPEAAPSLISEMKTSEMAATSEVLGSDTDRGVGAGVRSGVVAGGAAAPAPAVAAPGQLLTDRIAAHLSERSAPASAVRSERASRRTEPCRDHQPTAGV
jgi:hypothetical protein